MAVHCLEMGRVSLEYWALRPRAIWVPGSVGLDWGDLHVESVGNICSDAREAENRHPMKSGRKTLIAEAEPGVFTPEAFLTRVKGISPFTTGQTLMVVWKSKIQSTKPRSRKRVVTKSGAILEKIKEVVCNCDSVG